ncbi:hypothetical protein LEMLEM_LOCUS23494, partial [Lemmus lemmus]
AVPPPHNVLFYRILNQRSSYLPRKAQQRRWSPRSASLTAFMMVSMDLSNWEPTSDPLTTQIVRTLCLK